MFVPDEAQRISGFRRFGSLGILDDQEIAVSSIPGTGTFKFLSLEALHAFYGDPENRDDYTNPFIAGEIDALMIPRRIREGGMGPRVPFFSVSRRFFPVFLKGKTVVLDHATMVRLLPNGDAEVFLPSSLLFKALGFKSLSADIDAFCQDDKGNVFFSLALDETNGKSLYKDGDLLFIPGEKIRYSKDGIITDVLPGSALVAVREDQMDAMVRNSGIAGSDGKKILAITNLACLEVDPRGGTFVPGNKPSLGPLPNLVFGGGTPRWGMGLCSTSKGGSIAVISGRPLASTTRTAGTHLGIESLKGGPSDSYVCALGVFEGEYESLVLGEDHRGRLRDEKTNLRIRFAGLDPKREAVLLVSFLSLGPGKPFHSFFLNGPPFRRETEVFFGPETLIFPLCVSDGRGRGEVVLKAPNVPGFKALVVSQAFGPVRSVFMAVSNPVVMQWL